MKKVTEEGAVGKEVDYADNLNRCAWKLQGLAGLFSAIEDGGMAISQSEAHGLYFLLEQIADDILANTEKFQEVTA